ncbi:ricin-type beta-trefoil lectin domain protein [Streptomyces sp. NBC_00885]|uniref:RICIN domain-containing protein n=1 Tax=Streptomyces sp. NBC_00885 TaxID=2975857 RepID=UPI00386FD49F|nr:ricin-type beta-trefoil lectin domain protein [Streptomyces sp. NBC_00885]
MQNPRTPGPVPPSRTGLSSGDSDEGLAATLRTGGGTDEIRPVAVLLARHWQPVFDYTSICTPSATAASMLATAASNKVLENLRQVRTTAALRPLLLVTARQVGKAWAADERITALPELQNPDTGRSVPVDMFTIPENRTLVARAFQALPGPAQCLLWHAEAEGEGISVPAGLLAIDPRGAAAQLEQAREIFRAACLRLHVELAPDSECRHFSRLLDVSLRRGGTLIPDIKAHLAKCQHCRFGAEQLDQVGGRLALLLAEAVLGRAAQPYLDSRPARNSARFQAKAAGAEGASGGAGVRPPARGAGRHSRGGRPRALPRLSLSPRGRGAVVTGLGIMTGLLVVATAVTELWPDDDSHAGPAVPSGSVTAMPAPGSRTPSSPGPQPSTTSAAMPTGPLNTRLRNVGAGLCLDIKDQRVQAGTEATMAACSSAVTQQWVYETDGLLRSAAAVDLCLDSHELDGVAELGACTQALAADAGDVRYDLTIQGDVIPRWNEALALVPASAEAGSAVVVRMRDGSPGQRWATDNVAARVPRARPSADTGHPSTKEVNVPPPGGTGSAPAGTGAAPDPAPSQRYGETRSSVRRVNDGGTGWGSEAVPEPERAPRLRPAAATNLLRPTSRGATGALNARVPDKDPAAGTEPIGARIKAASAHPARASL